MSEAHDRVIDEVLAKLDGKQPPMRICRDCIYAKPKLFFFWQNAVCLRTYNEKVNAVTGEKTVKYNTCKIERTGSGACGAFGHNFERKEGK